MASTDDQLQDRIRRAIESEEVPTIYFNAFVSATAPADVTVVLEQNGRPVAALNMSYTIAKTLAESLAGGVREFERRTDTVVLTTHSVADKLGEAEED